MGLSCLIFKIQPCDRHTGGRTDRPMHTVINAVSQQPNGSMPDYARLRCESVRWPRFESHRGRLCSSSLKVRLPPLRYAALAARAAHPCCSAKSTQPSTLRGTITWVSALGLSKKKMAMVDVDGSCHFFLADLQSTLVGLVWGLAATSELSLHPSNKPGELSQWLCHDDSIINIISVIIIIIFNVSLLCKSVPPNKGSMLYLFLVFYRYDE